ncbi:hypothetical protein GMW39_07820 [Pectobacterium parmentieri]|uniref:hypothetical protein n=1 Tax=Pectobacterium parmentieri TaxID=1905730 RepID=UPI0013743191|nr:hypothetical protein [Pectobacterium parmentieri]QHQ15790.1 hypothetical protein GMW39_07820 [Pectobacterium parmentieri]
MIIVVSPVNLCIYKTEYRSETLNFLNKIDTLVILKKKKIVVDLRMVQYATAAASLLFFAIVNRAQLFVQDSSAIRFLFPKKKDNELGHRYIIRTALSKALLANTFDKITDLAKEDVYFQSGVDPDKHLFSTLQMLDKIANLSVEQLSLLSMGIGEAMLNVSHHAYESAGDVSFSLHLNYLGGRRWWQCSWFNPEKDNAVFIICDLGLGIAKSYNSLRDDNRAEDETATIKEALSSGKSKFIGLGRGNGSEDIKRPVGKGCTQNETLLVFSGNSQYYYTSETKDPVCYHLNEFIPGTLVQWSLVTRRTE